MDAIADIDAAASGVQESRASNMVVGIYIEDGGKATKRGKSRESVSGNSSSG